MASALINMARNTGCSIGISLANNVLAHREQFHQSRLVELVNTSTVQFQAALKQATDYFMAQGTSSELAKQQAFTWISRQVQTQATFLAYIDVFWALMLISAAAVPLALTLRKVKLGGTAPVAH
jgi:MFS transporter, DHA2 family, multidrug resistance protein